jgi:drug/metabolite transporter superfamily protein YnfA
MSNGWALLILFLAAVLEAGGDAIVRTGIRAQTVFTRLALLGLGGVVLFLYGYLVNAPAWDFGRLLGVYVVFFFVVAQLISWLVFSQPPTRAVWFGGVFIVIGGVIMSDGSR